MSWYIYVTVNCSKSTCNWKSPVAIEVGPSTALVVRKHDVEKKSILDKDKFLVVLWIVNTVNEL